MIKGYFSHRCKDEDEISIPDSRRSKGEKVIWQRRYWEHFIRNEKDLQNHIEYIHFNPVKHGYVNSAADWNHSSFMHYVSKGFYSVEWGSNEDMRYLDKFGSE